MEGTYELKKDGPGGTGMFWRAYPSGGSAPSANWPRDGGKLVDVL